LQHTLAQRTGSVILTLLEIVLEQQAHSRQINRIDGKRAPPLA
jgi:hypothetical protein